MADSEIGSAVIRLSAEGEAAVTAALERVGDTLSVFKNDATLAMRAAASAADIYEASLADLAAMKLPFEVEARAVEWLTEKFSRLLGMTKEYEQELSEIAARERQFEQASSFADSIQSRYGDPRQNELDRLRDDEARVRASVDAGDISTAEGERLIALIQKRTAAIREQVEAERELAVQRLRATEDTLVSKYGTDLEQLKRINEELREINRLEHEGKLTREEAEKARADNQKEAQRYSSYGRQVLAEQIEDERAHNLLQAQSVNLLKELSTAQDRHNARVLDYDKMLKKGMLTQEQYNEAVRRSQSVMRRESRLVGGDFAFQASYAIQDAATVMSMEGMRTVDVFRAMSNNVSAMLMNIQGLNPVLLGTAGAAAAVALALAPSVWEAWTEETKHAKDAADALDFSLKNLASSIANVTDKLQRKAQLSDLFAEGTPEQLDAEAKRLKREEEKAKAVAAAARSEEENRRHQLARGGIDFSKAVEAGNVAGSFNVSMDAAVRAFDMRVRKFDTRNVDDVVEFFKSVQNSGMMTPLAQEVFDSYRRGLAKLIEMDEGVIKAVEARKDAEKEAAQRIKERGEVEKEAETKRIDREWGNQVQFDRDVEDAQREGMRESRQSLWDSILERERAAAIASGAKTSEGFTIIDRFDEFLRKIMDSGLGDAERSDLTNQYVTAQVGEIDAKIAELQKQQPRRSSGFMDFSNYGQQFQMALLNDPNAEAKRQRDKQISILNDIKAELQKKQTTVVAAAAG